MPLVLLSMVANSLQFSSILWRTRHSSRSQLQCEVVAEEIKDVPPRSIGVASYFEKTMTTFGKTPITKLREVIKKYNPDVILPEDVGDLDSHCMLAMDSIWSASQDPAMSMGDDVVWPTFMMMLDKELSRCNPPFYFLVFPHPNSSRVFSPVFSPNSSLVFSRVFSRVFSPVFSPVFSRPVLLKLSMLPFKPPLIMPTLLASRG